MLAARAVVCAVHHVEGVVVRTCRDGVMPAAVETERRFRADIRPGETLDRVSERMGKRGLLDLDRARAPVVDQVPQRACLQVVMVFATGLAGAAVDDVEGLVMGDSGRRVVSVGMETERRAGGDVCLGEILDQLIGSIYSEGPGG